MRPQNAGPAESADVAPPPNGRAAVGVDPFELYLLAAPTAAGTARAAVSAWIGAAISEAMLVDVLLLVSELVTNSFRHADAPDAAAISVRADVHGDVLRLEVGDDGRSGAITRRAPGASANGGFGLNVVDVVSRRWGVDRDIGTRVWAELAFEPAA